MTECKFLNSDGKCNIMGKYNVIDDIIFPTGASVMGYCMAVVENTLEECDWFTEVE